MDNKQKILLALFSLIFLLLVYLIITSREIKTVEVEVSQKEELPIVDLVELENDYQKEAKNLYFELKASVENNNLEKEDLKKNLLELRSRLMAIIVPGDYRTFHLGLVMLIDDIVENEREVDNGLKEIINKMRVDNQWIN